MQREVASADTRYNVSNVDGGPVRGARAVGYRG